MHYTLLVVLYEIYMFCKLKKKIKKYSDKYLLHVSAIEILSKMAYPLSTNPNVSLN